MKQNIVKAVKTLEPLIQFEGRTHNWAQPDALFADNRNNLYLKMPEASTAIRTTAKAALEWFSGSYDYAPDMIMTIGLGRFLAIAAATIPGR